MSVKQFIQQQAIKNLLSAQKRIADRGSTKEVIRVTRFSLTIAEKFRDVFIKVGTEGDEQRDGNPVNDLDDGVHAKRMLRMWADDMRRENEERGRSKMEFRGCALMDFKYWIGKFLFHFGTVLLAICAAQVLFRCFS